MTLVVAPTEPAALRGIANVVSWTPERYGADVLWSSLPWGLCGVQRKTVADFVASVRDGRLAKESDQMQRLGIKVLMLEGRPRWTTDGLLADGYVRWNKGLHRGVLRSLQLKGVWVEATDDLDDTVGSVQDMVRWCAKKRHASLSVRPGPAKDEWGRVSSRDYAVHFLQGLEGVGVDLAGKIIDHFAKPPIRWADEVTTTELCKIDGIGKARAERLITALGGTVDPPKRRKRSGPKVSADREGG